MVLGVGVGDGGEASCVGGGGIVSCRSRAWDILQVWTWATAGKGAWLAVRSLSHGLSQSFHVLLGHDFGGGGVLRRAQKRGVYSLEWELKADCRNAPRTSYLWSAFIYEPPPTATTIAGVARRSCVHPDIVFLLTMVQTLFDSQRHVAMVGKCMPMIVINFDK